MADLPSPAVAFALSLFALAVLSIQEIKRLLPRISDMWLQDRMQLPDL